MRDRFSARFKRGKTSPMLAIGLAVAMVAGVLSASTLAGASTTITSSHTTPGIGADNLVRDNALTIRVSEGGFVYSRTTATKPYTYALPATSGLGLGCRGDLTTGTAAQNSSPRSTTTVVGPGGISLLDAASPAIDVSIAGALGGYPVLAPQPAPAQTVFLGDVPPSGSNGATPPVFSTPARGFTYNVDLTGQPAGVYTVTTTITNMLKTGLAACTVGTPVTDNTSSTGFGTASTTGTKVETTTFEYRPWQHSFNDITGAGSISLNVTPAESQQRIGSVTGQIISGGMKFYSDPTLATLALPSDPISCASDPSSCLPSEAVPCNPSAGCEPRIIVVDQSATPGGPDEGLHGIFDLKTGVFIAASRIGQTEKTLFSLGTTLDPVYSGFITQLRSVLSGAGVDPDRILNLGVVIDNGHGKMTLSLLNGLQIGPSTGKTLHITTDLGVQAGLMLNLFTQISPVACTSRTVSSADGNTRYVHDPGVPVGYTVETSDFLPNVPAVAGLDALGIGGPIYHITGDFSGPASPLLTPIKTTTVLAGAGVTPGGNIPNGLLSVQALVNGFGNATQVSDSMDFLGTATWVASETNVLGACLTVDFMLGAGVALQNNPLPIGFGTLPLWDANAGAASLKAGIDSAVATAVSTITTNPTVAGLLGQITGALPVPTP